MPTLGETLSSAELGGGGSPGGVFQEGVDRAGDYTVTRDSSSQVTVSAGVAYVDPDDGTRDLTKVYDASATVIGSIPAASAQNRVDQIIKRSSNAVPERLAGSEQSGADLDNGAGTTSRAALPSGAIRVHEFIVGTGGVLTQNTTNFRDRRPWARGAFWWGKRAATISPGTTYGLSHADQYRRYELSGGPVALRLLPASADYQSNNYVIYLTAWLDGAVDPNASVGILGVNSGAADNHDVLCQPSAGSHMLGLALSTVVNGNLYTSSAMMVRELPVPNVNNGTA